MHSLCSSHILLIIKKTIDMKNILLSLILILASAVGFSQASGIEIDNRSECDIYIQLRGAKDCPVCEVEYTSRLILIPAATSVSFPNTTTLGGSFPSPPVFLHSAMIYSGPKQCRRLETWIIGENQTPPPSKCKYPDYVVFYAMDRECKVKCEKLKAVWLNAEPTCKGIARLIITS